MTNNLFEKMRAESNKWFQLWQDECRHSDVEFNNAWRWEMRFWRVIGICVGIISYLVCVIIAERYSW